MGGIGSGRRPSYRRSTTEDVNQIDIRLLSRKGLLNTRGVVGMLSWSQMGEKCGSLEFQARSDTLELSYRVRISGEDWQNVEQSVAIERTPCNFGGRRPWFACPNCHRRVAILYGAGVRFLCRRCYGLPYASQGEDFTNRMIRKARKIRKRLKASEDLFAPIMTKPRGMHWRTFWELADRESIANHASNLEICRRWGLL